MALLFLDGFDKYGAANTNGTALAALLTAGEWTSQPNGTVNLVAGLSSAGYALFVSTGGPSPILSKTLGINSSRMIAGFRFSSPLTNTSGLVFYDGATAQASVTVNNTGTISVRNGVLTGTALGTSTATVTANSVHHIECDITFSNTGSYQVWLDGVSILSGSGDTTGTANSYANAVAWASSASSTLDDLYVFDTTGSTNNAVLLTSPRIETQFPSGDSAVQFAVGAAVLGTSIARSSGAAQSTAANQFRVRPFTPGVAMTLNSISFLPAATNASIQMRPVIYSDSSGAPGTLLSAGSTVTGITSGTVKTMPLTTPQSLSAGTQYWLGWMCDILVASSLTVFDGTTTDRTATSTFASGAPGTAPATSAAAATLIWGNVTVTSNNWYAAGQNPAQGAQSYVFDATVGHEDLFSFPALSSTPSAIYGVAVKANLSKSDAGAKTASVRLKSSATDSAGTGGTALAPGTTYGWMTSLYERDPNGTIAWTKTALDAATAGVKVET
jgi:hypothetical protein